MRNSGPGSEARYENALTLAATLGLDVERAAESLDFTVVVSFDHADTTAERVAAELVDLLRRTVADVRFDVTGRPAAEVVIGAAPEQSDAPKVFVSIGRDATRIGRTRTTTDVSAVVPHILALLVACYTAAAALKCALGHSFPHQGPDPFILRFADLGLDVRALGEPINLGRAYLAGCGAVGNGFLWAARHLDVRGQLVVADDDIVTAGNLNRQMWFWTEDVGQPKPERLVKRAQASYPNLELVPRRSRVQDLPEKADGPWLRRLFVAVDSRRARRQLQNEFPGEVFDASTTDIREVVLHHHRQPTANACLGCIYMPDEEEYSREQHIAEHIGVTVEQVRSERIDAAAAAVIASRFPQVTMHDLLDASYDTLFKRLCAESVLKTPAGRHVVAPFAFVSVLAGTMLALETVRRLVPGAGDTNFNYWCLSVWHPPLSRRRQLRAKERNCGFCGNPLLEEVNRQLWGGSP